MSNCPSDLNKFIAREGFLAIETEDLGGKAIRGASATLIGQGVRVFILLASTVVLARLLTPSDFGLFAIVISFIAFGELCRDFGLSSAASRAVEISSGQKSNLLWINFGLGACLCFVTYILAAPIAYLFDQSAIENVLKALSITFILSGFATQFRAEINRKLKFRQLAFMDTVPAVVGLLGALAYAWAVAPTYWVLVVQQVATTLTATILAVVLSGWWPGMPSRHSSIRYFLKYGLGVMGTQGIAYFTKNADNLALGYFSGPAALGIYSRAYQLLMMPLNQIAAPLTRVAVPVLTRVTGDAGRFERYLQSGQLVGGMGLGLLYAVGLGFANALVPLIFGPGWEAMIPVFQILAVGGIFRGLNQITFWAFLAKGETAAQFRLYAVCQPMIVILMLSGLPWGPIGVAAGHSIGYMIFWMISVWWCSRLLSTSFLPFIRQGALILIVLIIPISSIGLLSNAFINVPYLAIIFGTMTIVIYLGILWSVAPQFRQRMGRLVATLRFR